MYRADLERATSGHGYAPFFSSGQRAGTGMSHFLAPGNGRARVLIFQKRAGKRAINKNFKWHLNNKSPQPGNNSPEIFPFCSCTNMSSGIKIPSKFAQKLKKKSLKSAQGAKVPARLPKTRAHAPKYPPACPKRAPGAKMPALVPKCAPGAKIPTRVPKTRAGRQNTRPPAQNARRAPKCPPACPNARPV